MSPLSRRLRCTLLATLALGSCASEEEVGPLLEWRTGAQVRTRVQQDTVQELKELVISIDGEPLPAEMVGDIGVRITSSAAFVCEDHVEDVRAGRARSITRRFVDIQRKDDSSSQGPDGEVVQTTTFGSPLAGRRVRFLWNDRQRRYDATLVPEEGEALDPDAEGLVAGLECDLDLAAFLPAPGSEVGSEWPVSPRALAPLVQPGGDLELFDAQSGRSQAFDTRQFVQNLQGNIHARYRPPGEGDDAGLAYIDLSVRVETVIEQDLPPELDEFGMPTHSRIAIAYQLKGTLRWDLATGRARDLDLEGTATADSTQTVTGGAGDDVFVQSDHLRFEGTTHLRVDVEVQ